MMRMNSVEGQTILALVRQGDYAHAGEEEAIRLVFDPLPKPGRILDVGCGRGGTADFITRQGWGPVTGVDIDMNVIEVARSRYPSLRFDVADGISFAQVMSGAFDVIVSFNAFYAFADQRRALLEMRKVAAAGAHLALFDYTDPQGNFHEKYASDERFAPWQPLKLPGLAEGFQGTGWGRVTVENIRERYQQWYRELGQRIQARKREITRAFGAEWFSFVERHYGDLVRMIEKEELGGAIVRAMAE